MESLEWYIVDFFKTKSVSTCHENLVCFFLKIEEKYLVNSTAYKKYQIPYNANFLGIKTFVKGIFHCFSYATVF